MTKAREDGYDFITTEVPSDFSGRTDVTTLDGKWWRTSVVGVVRDPNHHRNEDPRYTTEVMMARLPFQLEWAAHMNLPAVILPAPPASEAATDYARVVQTLALKAQDSNLQLWVTCRQLTEESLQSLSLIHI